MEAIIAIVSTNLVTGFLRNYVYKKWGSTGVQVALFLVSLAVSAVIALKDSNMAVKKVMEVAVALFMSAMALYEVLWKKLPKFE